MLVAAALLLAGCGSASSNSADPPGIIPVVTSTNVWGDVVRQIGGQYVSVRALVADPAADPHSYEANAQDQLAISKARVIVENGGGYDDFVDTMVAAAGKSPTVLNAVQVSGLQPPAGGELNEHVWYDFPSVRKVADRILELLSAADPAHAAAFASAAKTFDAQLDQLIQREAAIRATASGVGVAITEPVPLYLLQACGMVDKTPAEFSDAVESETDVPAVVLNDTLKLFSGKQVKLLVYNSQTTGPQTVQVVDAATSNGIPLVPVTETLPAGMDYQSWMSGNLGAIEAALR